MKKDIEKRIGEIEDSGTDWISRLKFIDYLGLTDYQDGNWEDVHHDDTVTVYRNIETGEIRGVYADRRTDNEIVEQGGDLAYL